MIYIPRLLGPSAIIGPSAGRDPGGQGRPLHYVRHAAGRAERGPDEGLPSGPVPSSPADAPERIRTSDLRFRRGPMSPIFGSVEPFRAQNVSPNHLRSRSKGLSEAVEALPRLQTLPVTFGFRQFQRQSVVQRWYAAMRREVSGSALMATSSRAMSWV